jgi:3-methyl-2-oxobutanoate hydroxymethyltransferase
MSAHSTQRPKVTHLDLRKMKEQGERITMLTAYDSSFARLCDQAGTDVLLVGDSLGMVIQGHKNTLPVTLEHMIYHCQAVARGVEAATGRAMIVGDMPFMSYQSDLSEAMHNAGRLVKEGQAEAVKLEGGAEYSELAMRLVRVGIPVMGHIGLTPQSLHTLGGFKVQGRQEDQAARLKEDALSLEKAGCFSIVLEGIPQELAAEITASLTIPTIGIGAGPDCDGQVLVLYDLLGMNEEFRPRFVKRYENFAVRVRTAIDSYIGEVRSGDFPGPEHSFSRNPKKNPPRAQTAGVVSETEGGSVDAVGAGCIPLRPLLQK